MPRNPIPAHPAVDLDRFMGDWYVIANIPTRIERGAHNAVESYARDPDGTIATTFTFREGSFDGPSKRMTPRGFVRPDTGNAVWGMRFFWYFPAKFEYVVSYVDDAYTETIIGRSARDYVWIMARQPEISPDAYARLVERVRTLGYDTSRVRRVPQRWPAGAR
jgi:apolipoprotein D and lipocalin family protein